MKSVQMGARVAMVVALAVPAAAVGQMIGVSHPDEMPAATSVDGATQPMVYVPTPTAQTARPVLSNPVTAAGFSAYDVNEYKPYVPLHKVASFDPDASIVGDSLPMSMSHGAGDIDAGIVTHVDAPSNSLPQGTLIRAKMLQGLSTTGTVEGSEWSAELIEAVRREGRVYLPAGAVIRGRVTEVHGGTRISGRALLHLETVSVTMPDGSSVGLHAQVIDTNLNRSTKVDQEGTILHRDHRKEEAAVLALTTGSGAAAGGMIAGVPGALVGAGVGAGVSGVLWLKQDRQTELPRETQVTFELTRTMTFGGA